MQLLYLGRLVDAIADNIQKIKRRTRLAWACYGRFKRELYDIEDAPYTLKMRLFKTEVVDTLLYGCVTWTLGQEQFAEKTSSHGRGWVHFLGQNVMTG